MRYKKNVIMLIGISHIIIKQPNGLYALWSTILDQFLLEDATAEQIIKRELEYETKIIKKEIEKVDKGNVILSYKECLT